MVELEELPRFTPTTGFFQTIFASAKEGAELLFLIIIPAVAAVFFFIGPLKFIGVWVGGEFLVAEGIPGLEITDIEKIKKVYYRGVQVIIRV